MPAVAIKPTDGAEERLQEQIAQFWCNPLGFVEFAYPWGEAGTPLENETGPDKWQRKLLLDLGHAITDGYVENNGVRIECRNGAIYISARSGHGIGKSALMSWLVHWFQSCFANPQAVVTANTENQLKNKTWREVAKWHKLLINRHWFRWSPTKFTNLADPSTWFAAATPWSERSPEAFAGTHENHTMMLFDEASAIPDIIWENAEGAMTDIAGISLWVVFGNPTRNTGRFSETFKSERGRWISYEVDSRDSKRTNKELIQQWIDLFGVDSDFVRVRVRGMEPRAGAKQFIPNDIVEEAMGRRIHQKDYYFAPKVIGVDIAREGDDQTVVVVRQGKAMLSMDKYRGERTQNVAGVIAEVMAKEDPDHVFLDMGNTGAAVYDLLCGWGLGGSITGVWFGVRMPARHPYVNRRTDMWGNMRRWISDGGCLLRDNEMRDDLIAPQYDTDESGQVILEPKKAMKARGIASPDCGDALALTFAAPVQRKETVFESPQARAQAEADYNPLTYSRQDRGDRRTERTRTAPMRKHRRR